MPADRPAARRQKLLSKLKRARLQALLVTNFTNVSYLTGFSGDDSYLLIGPQLTILISDSRYATQIEQECPGLDAVIRKSDQRMDEVVGTVVRRAKLKTLGIESGSMTVDLWQRLSEKAKPLEFTPVAALVEELRMIKDAQEIGCIRKAIREAEGGFEWMRNAYFAEGPKGRKVEESKNRAGNAQKQPDGEPLTELRVAHELEHAMRRLGAFRASFEPIIAAGRRSALPHARATSASIQGGGFVLVDWGASDVSGYKSDLTRVLATDKISPKLAKIYRVVLNAHRRGIEAVRPGAKCADVDAAARAVIVNSGYGKNFGHGLGHGIGLEIHEGPRLNPRSEDTLAPGMVITIEPGIYLPGWGGVRIEDDILVTRDGFEILSTLPKELESVRG